MPHFIMTESSELFTLRIILNLKYGRLPRRQSAVKLSHPEKSGHTFQMTRMENGVYAVTVVGDLHGYEYVYRICNNLEWTETVDPYAKAVTVNGEKGVVFAPRSSKLGSFAYTIFRPR